MDIKIRARFDCSDFGTEITKKLKENGFVQWYEGEQTPMGYKIARYEILKPFDIAIKEVE